MNKKRLTFRRKQARELAFLKGATLQELQKEGYKIDREHKEYNRGAYNTRAVQEYVQLFD